MNAHWCRRLATMAHERAQEYRAPFAQQFAQEELPAAFAQSGAYPVYSTLTELHLLLNKLADEIDGEEEG